MPKLVNASFSDRRSTLAVLGGAMIVASLTVFLFIRTAGLSSSQENEAVKVYFADNISPAHRTIIEEFNRLHKGSIEVVPVDLPFEKFSTNERKELLARSLRSKSDKIDVFAVDLIWVPRFARWAEPLDRYFTPAEQQQLLSYAVQSCRYDGRLVAMPMYFDIGLMYYRRDIIRRLPDGAAIEAEIQHSISWHRLLDLRRRLGYRHKPYYIFQAKDYEGLVCNLLELAVERDSAFLSGAGFSVTAEPMQKALAMLVDFVKTGVSPKRVAEFDENMSYRYMLDSDAVFVRGWPNFVENFRRIYPDTLKLNAIGKAPLPHFGDRPPASVFGGWNLMVSKSSAKKEAAMEFIRFVESEPIQRVLFEEGGFIPIVNGVYQDSAFMQAHPELLFYRGLLRKGFHRPAFVDYTRISDILSYFAHLAIEQDLSVHDAVARAEAMIRSNEVLVK